MGCAYALCLSEFSVLTIHVFSNKNDFSVTVIAGAEPALAKKPLGARVRKMLAGGFKKTVVIAPADPSTEEDSLAALRPPSFVAGWAADTADKKEEKPAMLPAPPSRPGRANILANRDAALAAGRPTAVEFEVYKQVEATRPLWDKKNWPEPRPLAPTVTWRTPSADAARTGC
jgi:hypothetical protein